jgi:selenocysteine lyase/cysteine desulfurase
MLLLTPGLHLETLIEGGNGVNSLDDRMPDVSPERYESGTLPTPAIVGLCEGIRFVRRIGLPAIEEHERTLGRRITEMLANTQGVKVYAPQFVGSTVLFSVDGMPSDAVGRELDQRGFCVRCGLHCAALGHRTLNTTDNGAIRISFGFFNRLEQTELFYHALREIIREVPLHEK